MNVMPHYLVQKAFHFCLAPPLQRKGDQGRSLRVHRVESLGGNLSLHESHPDSPHDRMRNHIKTENRVNIEINTQYCIYSTVKVDSTVKVVIYTGGKVHFLESNNTRGY